jgi:metallophosphoesterase superfamily enzyme
MNGPQPSASQFELHPGIVALPHGLLWMERSRSLVAADAHFAYEEVIGGALPLWSTAEIVSALRRTALRMRAREIVFLGDIIHGSRMSEGAGRTVAGALTSLRDVCEVKLIAGNHEGRTRGAAVLGETDDALERDGWLLVHGDEPVDTVRCIVGHLHPSITLGGGASAPAFLSSPQLIVVPALTPYSPGLDVLSSETSRALRALNAAGADYSVVASLEDRVYPFGSLRELRSALRGLKRA